MAKCKIDMKAKDALLQRYLNGESVINIIKDTGIPRSTLYLWISEAKAEREKTITEKENQESIDPKTYFKQKEKIKKLETIITVLHTAFDVSQIPLKQKLEILETLYNKEAFSVRLMCETLSVPRGTFYNYIFRNKRGNTKATQRREIMRNKIQKIYDESNQIFGAAKIHAKLKEEGEAVSVEFVRELMHEMHLQSIRIGSKKQYTDENRKNQNLVKQKFTVERPNQVWVSDVTYYRFKDNTYYICVIMDLYARKIISYKVGFSNNTHLIKQTIKKAVETRNITEGLIFHSDQGSNYKSRTIRDYLSEQNIKQSFSKAGNPYDNSVIETFFSTLKQEELYRHNYRSESEFRKCIDKYISFYNNIRPHKTLQYKTPSAKEGAYIEAK